MCVFFKILFVQILVVFFLMNFEFWCEVWGSCIWRRERTKHMGHLHPQIPRFWIYFIFCSGNKEVLFISNECTRSTNHYIIFFSQVTVAPFLEITHLVSFSSYRTLTPKATFNLFLNSTEFHSFSKTDEVFLNLPWSHPTNEGFLHVGEISDSFFPLKLSW